MHGFNKQGEYSSDGSKPMILDNDSDVGTNCLSLITRLEGRKVRHKLYNMFVQSMESPSVKGVVGSHIKDWVQNPEPILEEAINKPLDTGPLRLEITLYLYEDANLPEEGYYTDNMSWLKGLFNSTGDIIRYNPIQTQFYLFCKCVPINLCLVDINNKLAFISLFFNSISGKINGFYIKNLTQTNPSYALRYYCFNNQISVVLLDYNKDSDNEPVRIQQDVSVRMPTKGGTLYSYLSNGDKTLHGCTIKPNTPQPKDVGLSANSTFNFVLPVGKSTSLLKSTALDRTDIAFKRASYPLLNYPDKNITLRSINKQLKEEAQQKKFEEQNKEKIDAITAANEQLEKDRLQTEFYKNIRRKIMDLFKSIKQTTKRFVDLDNGTIKYCFVFRSTQTCCGKSYLLACADVDTIKEDTTLELFWATSTMTPYLDKYTSYCPKIDNSTSLHSTTIGKYLIAFRKEGEYYSQSRNKCASIKILRMAKPETIKRFKEEEKDFEVHIKKNKPLEELPPTVKAAERSALDDKVEEGEVLLITGYR